MKQYKILFVALLLICLGAVTGCRTQKTMEQPLDDGHFLVQMNEGYNNFDLREILGPDADKILPSSRSESIFLVHLLGSSQEVETIVSKLKENRAIKSVETQIRDPEIPVNGKNNDMKKTKPLGEL